MLTIYRRFETMAAEHQTKREARDTDPGPSPLSPVMLVLLPHWARFPWQPPVPHFSPSSSPPHVPVSPHPAPEPLLKPLEFLPNRAGLSKSASEPVISRLDSHSLPSPQITELQAHGLPHPPSSRLPSIQSNLHSHLQEPGHFPGTLLAPPGHWTLP